MNPHSGIPPHDAEAPDGATPLLSGLKKHSPFRAPEAYFERLPDQILEKTEEAPLLYSLQKTTPFTEPETYFDRFPATLQEQLPRKKAPLFRRISRLWWIPSGVAAGLALLLWLQSPDTVTAPQQSTLPGLADVSSQEVNSYVQEEIALLSLAELSEFAEIPENLPNSSLSALHNDEIEAFILEEMDLAELTELF